MVTLPPSSKAHLKLGDEGVGEGRLRRGLDLLLGSAGLAPLDVLADGSREENRFLFGANAVGEHSARGDCGERGRDVGCTLTVGVHELLLAAKRAGRRPVAPPAEVFTTRCKGR